MPELSIADSRAVFRPVVGALPPAEQPEAAQRSKDIKNRPPTPIPQDRRSQRESDDGARIASAPTESGGTRIFLRREPAGEGSVDRGNSCAFSGAQQRPDR